MRKNSKTAWGGIPSGFVNNHLIQQSGAHQMGFLYSTQNYASVQCRKCSSDYMRFAVDGICIDCQQKAEFVVREFPHVARRALGGGADQ